MRGVIAAGHPDTVEAGAMILEAGGNAFDATVAAVFAACVAEPVLASLGGGGFLVGQEGEGEPLALDCFVQTPRQRRPLEELDFHPITADFGTTTQDFHIGLGSMATPGLVAGLFGLHGRYGRLPMTEVLAPAVQLAREGVELNPLQGYIFSIVAPIYVATPGARDLFTSDGAAMLRSGDRYRNPALSDLLDNLGREGPDLFYRGDVAHQIHEASREQGGHLHRDDMAAYRPVWREPIARMYRGVDLLINPPPSSGGLLLAFALHLLESQDPAMAVPGSLSHVERLSRVMELTERLRADWSGPLDESVLAPESLQAYASQLAGLPPAHRGTTHVSVLDALGNAAAMSLSNGEGCGWVVPHTGVMMNNMLGEQDLNPEGFHRWPTDSRMTSMMAPTVARWPDGRLLALGSGGSNRLRNAILQVLVHCIDHDLPLDSAVSAPRLHYEAGLLNLEGGLAPSVCQALVDGGRSCQVWQDRNLFFGGAHCVERYEGGFRGAGDPRRGGVCRVI
ncbi:gamma-glutamyltranspeptidase [Ectothiorhodospira haloalkaliphila]|uniref:Gamma-glutamyltranspeptidase n=1 Tax=Ectothiorhodospira haloalkaliphila TaxID=421628 RepID=W8L4B7_9GAMM|nr:gamma-glutamyltransferase [Ectothiorhodospira haloalkaliphila]AHK78755.1 gamma-glutamyltranspeptidase [Ectothiorhodospira haloalkaliphila]